MASINIKLDTVDETNRRGYTYRDVDYNFVLDSRGFDFNTFDDINSIRNGLVNIFTWRRGERIILPEFGNTLYRFLYEPMTIEVLNNIQVEIIEMIERWEPRVSVVDVSIKPFPDQNEILIELQYAIPTLTDTTIDFSTIISDAER